MPSYGPVLVLQQRRRFPVLCLPGGDGTSTESTDARFDEGKPQSVRLNPNDRAALTRIVENSDEWGNASAALRGLIRQADEQASADGGPPSTTDSGYSSRKRLASAIAPNSTASLI